MDVSERIEATQRAQEQAASSNVIACWSCRGPVEAAALFCPTCAAVQPPGQADHFVRLGFPVDYAVDTALLDRRYFERQRLLHPDRFVTRAPRERALSASAPGRSGEVVVERHDAQSAGRRLSQA